MTPPPAEPSDAGSFRAWLDGTLAVLRGEAEADVPCAGCTACCESSQFVLVEPDEHDARTHIPAELLFPAPGAPKGFSVIPYDERGRCPMLGADGCTIYEHRPRTCRAYDCRVLTAAAVDVGAAKPAIRKRASEWTFELADGDEDALDAIRRAASFLDERGDALPGGTPPPTQRAALAIEVHDLFVEGRRPNPDEVVVVVERRRS